MISFTEWFGFMRSRIIYDFKPCNMRKMVKFYAKFIRRGDICFDIGAHTGSRSSAFLKLGARVIALEPNPTFARLMEHKFRHNRNFTMLTNAIGRKLGTEKFMISLRYPSISTLSNQWKDAMLGYQSSIKWEKEQWVNVITLDELIKAYGEPAFCKIDVEGFEEEALLGLSKPLPALSFEFFPTTIQRTITCIKRLAGMGNYRYNWSLTESFILNSNKWLTEQDMIEEMVGYRGRKSGDIYAVLHHN